MEWKIFTIDKTVYSQDSLLMTEVDLADRFVLQISEIDGGLSVKMRSISGVEITEEDENFFLQRLAHNEIRFRLQAVFAPIENAIVQKAFNWNRQ